MSGAEYIGLGLELGTGLGVWVRGLRPGVWGCVSGHESLGQCLRLGLGLSALGVGLGV